MVEYRGSAFEQMSMEGRMTVCNMSIEWGARAGMIAPDETTFDYLQGPRRTRRRAPSGTPPSSTGRSLRTDDDAEFDAEVVARRRDARRRSSPGAPTPARARRWRDACPTRPSFEDESDRVAAEKALAYMGLDAGHAAARHHGRHRLRRLVHQRPHRGPARRRRRHRGPHGRRRRAHARRARLDAGAAAGRGRRAWTRSSPPPAPSGARPAARCAWA